MFELDLSVRERGRVETEEVVEIITEEDALMESLFDAPSSSTKRVAEESMEEEERKRLRLVIDAAFGESEPPNAENAPAPRPPAPVRMEPQEDIKEMWKHAGLLREYGGVRAWMAMQKTAPGGVQSGRDSDAR
jgi:hypothetical protein